MPQHDPITAAGDAIATSEALTRLNKTIAQGMYDVLSENIKTLVPPALAPMLVGEVIGIMVHQFVKDNPTAAASFRQMLNSLIDIAEERA